MQLDKHTPVAIKNALLPIDPGYLTPETMSAGPANPAPSSSKLFLRTLGLDSALIASDAFFTLTDELHQSESTHSPDRDHLPIERGIVVRTALTRAVFEGKIAIR